MQISTKYILKRLNDNMYRSYKVGKPFWSAVQLEANTYDTIESAIDQVSFESESATYMVETIYIVTVEEIPL